MINHLANRGHRVRAYLHKVFAPLPDHFKGLLTGEKPQVRAIL